MKIKPEFIKAVKKAIRSILGILWIALHALLVYHVAFHILNNSILGFIYFAFIFASILFFYLCGEPDATAKAMTGFIFDLPEIKTEEEKPKEKPLYYCIPTTPDYSLKQTCCTDFHGSTIMEQLRQSQNSMSQIYSNCPTDIMTQILDAQLRQTRDQINQTQVELNQSIQTAFLYNQSAALFGGKK